MIISPARRLEPDQPLIEVYAGLTGMVGWLVGRGCEIHGMSPTVTKRSCSAGQGLCQSRIPATRSVAG
jgi:hypothetical protein